MGAVSMPVAKPLGRVLEPDTGLVHYSPYPTQDAVTLCNITDWFQCTHGKPTKAAATCNSCRNIVDYVRSSKP